MTDSAPPNLDQLLQHAAWVRRLALSLCADPGRADDAVQETWLSAMQAPPRHAGNLRAWLGQALRNVLRQRGREDQRRRRRDGVRAQPPFDFAEAAGDAAARAEMHRHLVQLVLALPEPQRALVLMHYFDGDDVAALAQRARLTPDAVRAHLRRARASLRAQLERAGGDAARGFTLLLAAAEAKAAVAGGALLGIAMSLKTKLALAALAVASVFLWWPSGGASEAVPAESPASVAALSAAGPTPTPAPHPPVTPPEQQRTAIAAGATGRTLTIELQGLLPQVPWTGRLRIEFEGDVGTDRPEHEDRIAVAGSTATARVPAWIATAENLKLRIDGGDPFYLPVAANLRGDAARAETLTLAVQPVGVITGRVVDARGEGVMAARIATFAVDAGRPRNVITGETTTRADGSFTLQSRIEGALLLVALPMQPAQLSGATLTMEGGAVADSGTPRDDLLPASAPVEVRHGDEHALAALTVGDPAWVTGEVRFAHGPVIAKAKVQAYDLVVSRSEKEEPALRQLSIDGTELVVTAVDLVLRGLLHVEADPNGRFRVPLVAGRQARIFFASAPGVDTVDRAHMLTVVAPAAVKLELGGRLLTLSPVCGGKPVGKYLLLVKHGSGVLTGTNPNKEGRSIVLADARRLTGRIEAVGYDPASLDIDVAAAPDVIPVEMVRTTRTTRLQLDLVADTHVRQAVLHFEPRDGGVASTHNVFRNDGVPWFEIDLRPGRYRLRVEAPRRAERRDLFVLPSESEIVVGAAPEPIQMLVAHGGSIRLEVVDGRGLPLRGTVELWRDGARVKARWLAANAGASQPDWGGPHYEGATQLAQPIQPGRWSLVIAVPGRGDKRVELDVKVFEVAEVRVQF